MKSTNPYQASKSIPPPSRNQRNASGPSGPILMLGTVCLLLLAVVQLAVVRNPVSMIGLPLFGIISLGTAFSIHRSTKKG